MGDTEERLSSPVADGSSSASSGISQRCQSVEEVQQNKKNMILDLQSRDNRERSSMRWPEGPVELRDSTQAGAEQHSGVKGALPGSARAKESERLEEDEKKDEVSKLGAARVTYLNAAMLTIQCYFAFSWVESEYAHKILGTHMSLEKLKSTVGEIYLTAIDRVKSDLKHAISQSKGLLPFFWNADLWANASNNIKFLGVRVWWAVFSLGEIVRKTRFLGLAPYRPSKALMAGRKPSEVLRTYVNALLDSSAGLCCDKTHDKSRCTLPPTVLLYICKFIANLTISHLVTPSTSPSRFPHLAPQSLSADDSRTLARVHGTC
jgi:hypothetical protein